MRDNTYDKGHHSGFSIPRLTDNITYIIIFYCAQVQQPTKTQTLVSMNSLPSQLSPLLHRKQTKPAPEKPQRDEIFTLISYRRFKQFVSFQICIVSN